MRNQPVSQCHWDPGHWCVRSSRVFVGTQLLHSAGDAHGSSEERLQGGLLRSALFRVSLHIAVLGVKGKKTYLVRKI